MYWLTVLFFIIIILGVISVIYVWCKDIVSKNSPLLSSLRQLNKKYHFHSLDSEYRYSKRLQSKAKYDRYNLNELFEDNLRFKYNYWKSIQKMLQENESLFREYSNEYNTLSITRTSKTKHFLIADTIWNYFEMQLFKKEKLSPVIHSKIVCEASYSSPQGRNNYSKHDSFPFSIIDSRYFKLQEQQYLKQTIKYQRKKERNKLTDKLRYTILKRDHYRCQICGRSAQDGIKLHVDHIKPIAKGGLTIESNLRTLCENCNWGKSDDY